MGPVRVRRDVAYGRYELIDNDGLPSIVPEEDEAVDADGLIALEVQMRRVPLLERGEAYSNTERLDEFSDGGDGGQGGQERSVAQSALDDIVRSRLLVVVEKVGLVEDLRHTVDVSRGIFLLCKQPIKAVFFVVLEIELDITAWALGVD